MDGMKQFPDKYFDLAIVDPPYGGGASQNVHVERESGLQGGGADFEERKRSRFGGRFDRYFESDESDRGTVCKVRSTEAAERGFL